MAVRELISAEYIKDFTVRAENIEALEDNLKLSLDEFSRLKRFKDRYGIKDAKIPKERIWPLFEEVSRSVRDVSGLSSREVGKVDLSIYNWKHYAKWSSKLGAGALAAATLISLIDGNGISQQELFAILGFPIFLGAGTMAASIDPVTNHSGYHADKNDIHLRNTKEEESVNVLADGYTRHILHQKTNFQDTNWIFARAFINGVTRHATGKIETFPGFYSIESLGELIRNQGGAYRYLCEVTGKNPRGILLLPESERKGLFRIDEFYKKFRLDEQLAFAAFSACEEKFGDAIYPQTIREDFSYLR